MHLLVNFDENNYKLDLNHGHSIAIANHFDQAGPLCFHHEHAHIHQLYSTQENASCNVAVINGLIPHCQGTHTESVRHLIADAPTINRIAPTGFFLGELITLTSNDKIIEKNHLTAACQHINSSNISALIIRTDARMQCKQENQQLLAEFPYFSAEAMQWIHQQNIDHLLVEMPSIDRIDDTTLSNHRIFWQVSASQSQTYNLDFAHRTITEFISAPNNIVDGLYAINLQIPNWSLDAAPSNPIIYLLEAY